MRIDLEVLGADAAREALEAGGRQALYAGMLAINRTVEEANAAAREQVQRAMTVRQPQFILPPIVLPRAARATKQNLEATAALGYPDVNPGDSIGARREQILRKFEYGGQKTARDPMVPIAIPTTAIRPSPTSVVPRALYPVNLGLTPRRSPAGDFISGGRRGKVRTLAGGIVRSARARGRLQLEGIGGTYAITDETGRPLLILQRTGRGHRDARVIWILKQRIPIPFLIPFEALATRVMEDRFEPNFAGALELALRTAK